MYLILNHSHILNLTNFMLQISSLRHEESYLFILLKTMILEIIFRGYFWGEGGGSRTRDIAGSNEIYRR